MNDWWLDAVCGERWDAIFSGDAAFAFPFKRKYGLKLISMPMLTLGLGPVAPHGMTQLSQALFAELPPFDLFDLFLLPGVDFAAEKGFKLQVRNTYQIDDLSNPEELFAAFSSSTRQQIRKAQKLVTVSESDDVELLYRMVSLTFKRQSKKTPYTLAFVKSIHANCEKRRCCRILVARGADGHPHAACLVAWDQETAYYVLGGADPRYRSSAAYSLLMWEAIQTAARHAKIFDFCGSSIPSIARFFEGFGAKRTPYLHLRKINSKALKIILAVKK